MARIAMIEKGLDVEPTIVDPWADDARLRDANAAARVPTLILDDGTPLAESLLIVQWLERTRPAPDWPDLLGRDTAGVLSRAGIALGVIDAAVHTIMRFTDAAWLPPMPVLDAMSLELRARAPVAKTMPR
jgi:glutathione S-transferase